MLALQINRESRNETLRHYQLFYNTNINDNGYTVFERHLKHSYLYKKAKSIEFFSREWGIGKIAHGDLSPILGEFLIFFPNMKPALSR